jgi:hypothetical protein
MKTIFENKSKYWSRVVLSIAVLGILLILYDRLFGSYLLLNLGGILFSISGIMIGIEAIVKRKIILRSPYHRRLSETYLGVTAVAQALIIIITGLFLIGLLVPNYLNSGRSLFLYFVQHPGVLFLLFSLICFLTAVIVIVGSMEDKLGYKFEIILNLLASRFLSGAILVILGIIFLCLGLLELINPEYFDSIGGGYLEILFLGSTIK